MKSKFLFASILTMALAACGGGGGSGEKGSDVPDRAPETEKGATNGKASHGPVVDASISAYDFDGDRDSHRGSTRTDREGKYRLQLQVSDRPILMSSQGGSYVDEATGRNIEMGNDELTAVIFYEAGKNIDVQLTYFTTLATCRAEYLINRQDKSVGNAINIANNEWSAILGVDIVGVQPIDVTQPIAFTPFMTPAHQYGIALAGVSELVEKVRIEDGADESNSAYTVKYLTRVACNDIRFDGKLDGIGAATPGNPSGQLYIGSTALNIDLYRRALGQGVINFGGNKNNATGLGASEFLELANGISTSSSAVFGGVEGSSVDNEGPVVTSTVAQGTLVNDIANISFNVGDPLGVKSVTFYIDGQLYAEGQPTNPVLVWDTSVFSEGEHTVTVTALDVLDNATSEDFVFTVVNSGPGIFFTSSQLTNQINYLATGGFISNGATVETITVNGVNATIDVDSQTWEATVPLSGGDNLVQVKATDELGNSRTLEQQVKIDQIQPVLRSRDTSVRYSDLSGQLNLCEYGDFDAQNNASRPICLNAERISLNGAEISRSLSNDDYILIGLEIEDPQGQGVFTSIANLDLEYSVTLNDELLVDWREVPRPDRSQRTVYLPVTTEYFGDFVAVSQSDLFVVTVRLSDEAGNNDKLDVSFTLDVLTPPFILQANVVNSQIFDRAFDSRHILSGAVLDIEYVWENTSFLPYLIKVDPSENHVVQQHYEGAQRENLARDVANEQWQIQECDDGGNNTYSTAEAKNCAYYGTGWSDYKTVSALRVNGDTKRPKTRVEVSAYRSVNSDTVSARSPSGWSTSTSRFSFNLGCSFGDSDCFDGDLYDPDSGHFGAMYWSDGDSRSGREINFRSRNVYSVEYGAGYPRNNITQYETNHAVNSSSIRVYNVTHAVEILPQDGGWYEIPSNVQVKITKKVTLPSINYYVDSRVSQDDSSIPYTYKVYEDLAINYGIDTDITVTRAINPGSIDDIDQVSQIQSLHGNGVYNKNIVRN